MELNLYIVNHGFRFEIEALTRLFFPNDRIIPTFVFDDVSEPYIYTETDDKNGEIKITVKIEDFNYYKNVPMSSDNRENGLLMAQTLYKMLKAYSGISQPWGLLTGVRPAKLFRKLCLRDGEASTEKRFRDVYFVSKEKIDLLKETEKNERRILELSKPESFSLYVGIPFCPSRCSYCSFVMSSIEKTKKLVQPYTELLREEIKRTAEIANTLNLKLETVYFGGGTPTALNAKQLDVLLKTVCENFDMSTCREFTVEAGRPDTIDIRKLNVLKANGVDRISINPQTVNDKVLQNIGRRHTAAQFFEAYELARRVGFKTVNTDLIVGLPGDSEQSFRRTLEEVSALEPECITIHTLCLKRASTLTAEGNKLETTKAKNAAAMLRYARRMLTSDGYLPYYLYRQSRMVGNLENVGWSKPGHEGLYNVYIMDETHTILSCGASGVTKLREPNGNNIERVYNYKYPYEYIERFDELIGRKEQILKFYG